LELASFLADLVPLSKRYLQNGRRHYSILDELKPRSRKPAPSRIAIEEEMLATKPTGRAKDRRNQPALLVEDKPGLPPPDDADSSLEANPVREPEQTVPPGR